MDLNTQGYRHFSVCHKTTFKAKYRNVDTGGIVTVHTNMIEGAWKHAMDYFRRMSGTKVKQFEGHLAEIMWRSQVRGNIYAIFFQSPRKCVQFAGTTNIHLYNAPV